MSAPHKSPSHGLHTVQQPGQLAKPAVAQPKTAAAGRPVAPPAYRPQPTPKVLQTKSNGSSQPPVAPSGHKPQAPPPYRPQPTPKVLQTKSAARQVNQPGRTPAAPPAQRPQAVAQTAPLKGACTHGRACNPTLRTAGHHPAPGHLQMKDGGARRVFPNPATGRAPVNRLSSVAPQGPGPVAVQRSLAPGGAHTFTHLARTIQLKGDAIQAFGWDSVGYIYDAIAASSIIAMIVGAIASAASAGGLGWLAPLFIPLAGTAIQNILRIEAEEKGNDLISAKGRKEKYLEVVSVLVNGLTGVVGVLVGSGAITAGAAIAGVVAFIMIVLEGLRIYIIDRETVWGLVKSKIQQCRGVESQPILASNNI